ncbi:putative signal peptide protein [Puccinia sorghi]|uniref:Putative signal peptide protein n=1 Tax=Puccinia sorghi TaxID=27349 RepID=A0A0L6U6Y2_9BASI|nr:putative signal peptide protein [Puccinia sorghi]
MHCCILSSFPLLGFVILFRKITNCLVQVNSINFQRMY